MFKPTAIILALSLALFPASQQANEQRVIVTHKSLPAPQPDISGGQEASSLAQQPSAIKKIELPDMGDSSGTLISPSEEKEFG